MALPIASIPVLTGEVAQRFEADAQAIYDRSLHRSEEEKVSLMKKYHAGMDFVRSVLAKSKLANQ